MTCCFIDFCLYLCFCVRYHSLEVTAYGPFYCAPHHRPHVSFSPVERTWCSPPTCRISWRDSERSPCWGFWPWRALCRSGWDYRASRMDRYPRCSSVAVLQHNGNSGLTAMDRVSLVMIYWQKHRRCCTAEAYRGKNNLQWKQQLVLCFKFLLYTFVPQHFREKLYFLLLYIYLKLSLFT